MTGCFLQQSLLDIQVSIGVYEQNVSCLVSAEFLETPIHA